VQWDHAVTAPVEFPDISHYQAGLSLTGASFVVAKATEGTGYTDPSYAGFRDQADRLGIGFAAYHWIDTSDLAAQAMKAYSVAGGRPLMWDAEAAGATVPRLVELTTRYRALGGNPRAVYLPHWWWWQLGSPSLLPLANAGLFLISSNYPTSGYTPTGPGWAPYGGMTPQIWQYTDKQQFNGQPVDFNAYRGTLDELHTLWGLSVSDPSMGATPMMIATDGVKYYLCDGMRSRPVDVHQIPDLEYLAKQGLMTLAKGAIAGSSEWTMGGLVRTGWTEANFGLLDTASGPVGGKLNVSLTGMATPA
jgi:hypothetical protein